jgi:cytochrome c oxidase assembly factor CtaG
VRTVLAATSLLLSATPAFAHEVGFGIGFADELWSTDPWLLVPLYAAAILFLVGTWRLWRRAGSGRGIRYWQAACFWAGWSVVAIALVSPLHWLSEQMLTAHMVEHEFLMVAAAPLLVLSRPLTAFLWALPIGARRWFGTLAAAPPIAALWIALTNATVAMPIHVVTIFAWHTPSLFEAAISNPFLHKLQHATFLVTALLFWWAILNLPKRQFGVGAAHLFATMMAMSLLGGLLTLTPRLWYPSYSAPPLDFTPLEDQQLAGLVMWIPGCSVYAIAALVFLGVWIAASGRHELQLAKIEVLPTG